jgi:hypothetical protein
MSYPWVVNEVRSWTLTARSKGAKRTKTIYAADRFDATLSAIKHIMNASHDAPPGSPWRVGRIELRDSNGTLIHEMPAQGEEED